MYVWAKIPGCRVVWPVKLKERYGDIVDVYCKSDDAIFTIPLKNTYNFVNEKQTFKDKGIDELKKKKNSLAMFLCDFTLAESNEHSGDNGWDNDVNAKLKPDRKQQSKTDTTQIGMNITDNSGDNGWDNDVNTKLKPDRKQQAKTDTTEIAMNITDNSGKTGRAVPVIIPNETMKGLQFLTNFTIREQCGISRDNPYVFAKKGSTCAVVRAYTSLSKAVNLSDLKSPELITSTQLRKYMATITQVLDLKDNQLNWITNHLGHTLDVHKIYYRASSDVLERMQIAKILLLQDSGQVHKYVNKSLDEIQLTDIVSESHHESLEVAGSSNDIEMAVYDEFDIVEPQKKKKAVSSKSIVKWSKEEEDEIQTLFRKYFEKKKRPKPSVCQNAISISKSNNGLIYKRTKETLKKKIFRMIDKLNN